MTNINIEIIVKTIDTITTLKLNDASFQVSDDKFKSYKPLIVNIMGVVESSTITKR